MPEHKMTAGAASPNDPRVKALISRIIPRREKEEV